MIVYDGELEQWLTAERQLMLKPDALTAFLGDRAVMLDAVRFDPTDTLNRGATKSGSHIGQCKRFLDVIELVDFTPLEQCQQLGNLASKALKVASGYSMRAGYFHPGQPEKLYRDRMVGLMGADGSRLPVLGAGVAELASAAFDTAGLMDPPRTISDIRPLFEEGRRAAEDADLGLQDILLTELRCNSSFSGSEAAHYAANELTMATRGLFAALSVGALQLQGDGPDGLGALILEPKSDANALQYLRVGRIEATVIDGVTSVSSAYAVARM